MAEICNLIPVNETLDLTTLNDTVSISLDREISLLSTECYVEVLSDVSTENAAPSISLQVNSNEVATLILPDSTAKGAIRFFVPISSEITSLPVNSEIDVVCNVNANGSSPAGQVKIYLGVK